jgi:hypothetical protein
LGIVQRFADLLQPEYRGAYGEGLDDARRVLDALSS